MSKLDDFKSQFYLKKTIHLNNAGVTPTPLSTRTACEEWLKKTYELGSALMPEYMQVVATARKRVAELINASPDQVIFSASTATAISQVAFGIKLTKGDEVIVWDQEYPSNFYPWKVACERAGASLKILTSPASMDTPVSLLLENVTDRTKVIATSWVQYRTGAMADIKELTSIARKRNIFTCADVIQGVGVVPFDFKESGLDAICGGSHKWLCGLQSVGYLVLRPEWIDEFFPISIGAMSYGDWNDLSDVKKTLKKDSGKFEPGGPSFLLLHALGSSLQLLSTVGIDNIYNEAMRLRGLLSERLSSLGYFVFTAKMQAPILTFKPTAHSPLKSVEEITEKLRAHSVTFAARPPGVRLSPHAFNRDVEIEQVAKILG